MIGYSSNNSLENIIDSYLNKIIPYVFYIIHAEKCTGIPIEELDNDVIIYFILLNKSTNAYRVILYNNKGLEIYTNIRIDNEWKQWKQII